jgi:dienelactone hydrolase
VALFGTAAFAQSSGEDARRPAAVLAHTPASARALVAQARVAVPAQILAPGPLFAPLSALPTLRGGASQRVALVIFLHDSAGLADEEIGAWQQWLAEAGIASIAPDSMLAPGRPSVTGALGVEAMESIHALRASEIGLMLTAVHDLPWVDLSRVVLAGSGEGAVAVARYSGHAVAARMLFGWSCEDNFFVEHHRTVASREPVLNIVSNRDPLFSRSNPALGRADATGNCANALQNTPVATVVLLPGAAHSVFNLPAARVLTLAWLKSTLSL